MSVAVDYTALLAIGKPHLRLERESDKWWIVLNAHDEVMLRAEYPTCIRFAYAFKKKHPDAVLDDSFGLLASVTPGPVLDTVIAELFSVRADRAWALAQEAESTPLAEVIPLRKETA